MASSDVDADTDLQFEFRLAVWNNNFREDINFLIHTFLAECVYEYIYTYIYVFSSLQQKHLQQYNLNTDPITPSPNVPLSKEMPFYLSLSLLLFHTHRHGCMCHVSELGILNFHH